MAINQKFPHVLTGPEHLERGLRMLADAETVLAAASTADDVAAARLGAEIGRGYIDAATVLTFGTLAAGEDLGEAWLELLDPDGELTAAREAERAAELERRQQAADEHQQRVEELRVATAAYEEKIRELRELTDQPVGLYPYNPGPLVPPSGYPTNGDAYPTPHAPSYGAAFAGPDREELVSDEQAGRES